VAVLAAACGSDDGSTAETAETAEDPAGDAAAAIFGPGIAPNDHLGPEARSAMHNDSGSSDTTGLPGPGTGSIDATPIELGAVCPAILIGSDDHPVSLCTRTSDVRPVVHLLDPQTGSSVAELALQAGNLFSGVYGYLDDADRLVMVDGSNDLLRVAHQRDGSVWSLEVDQRTPLDDALAVGDSVTSVAPGYDGEVWFATADAMVGYVDTTSGTVETVALEEGEQVANSISTAPEGTAVATDHALYLVAADDDGRPEVRWRVPYDRGPARKPGQLSWGTGSSPTFFGPTGGSDYLAMVDNADPEVHLLVVSAAGEDAGEEICAPVVLAEGGPGSENSPIGAGRTVIVASTYGYEYPALPEGAGPSEPESAPFEGGMTRVDVRPDGSGCDVVWDSPVRSAAVPKLSTADNTVVTMTRETPDGAADRTDDTFSYSVISAETGELLAAHDLGDGAGDPLQLAGTTGPDSVLYQGTVGTVMRIAPATGGGVDVETAP
jgi:hypothetical protein